MNGQTMRSNATLLSADEAYSISASEESIIFDSSVCKKCELFDFYQDSMDTGKRPNNCVKWLCNSGACPKDEAIRQWIENFER